ncbi:hypothetical protein OF001_U70066 [Pseudomonas sp. OF001]|nr:hypothetical protein OF001_U70066 [Pseudomonas sp. OF001]
MSCPAAHLIYLCSPSSTVAAGDRFLLFHRIDGNRVESKVRELKIVKHPISLLSWLRAF